MKMDACRSPRCLVFSFFPVFPMIIDYFSPLLWPFAISSPFVADTLQDLLKHTLRGLQKAFPGSEVVYCCFPFQHLLFALS